MIEMQSRKGHLVMFTRSHICARGELRHSKNYGGRHGIPRDDSRPVHHQIIAATGILSVSLRPRESLLGVDQRKFWGRCRRRLVNAGNVRVGVEE